MMFVDPGLITGGLGLIGALGCLLALRYQRATWTRSHAELGSEVRSLLGQQKAEHSEQIARLGDDLTVLELSARNIDEAGKGGLTRSARAQAMQLIRSGMPAETAALTLGIGKREMRLIAKVTRILSPQ